jgi:predicted secreted hydrolase
LIASTHLILLGLVMLVSACSEQVDRNSDAPTINPRFLQASGEPANPNYHVQLPSDHQSHPNFDIEWWYLTANLVDQEQQPYAFQWTLFRFSNPNQNNPWHKGQTFMAHTSLHTPSQHWFEERFAAAGVGNARVGFAAIDPDSDVQTLTLTMDDWRWQAINPDGGLFPATLRASVTNTQNLDWPTGVSKQAEIALTLVQRGPFVMQGVNGYSVKSAEGKHASHYYSLPFIDVTGSINTPEGEVSVRGKAWYDHEWTSTLLDSSTAGWDWMSLHFDNGDKLMAFSMRLNDQENYQTGTYINANGTATALTPDDITLQIIEYTKTQGKELPLHWQVSIPSQSINIEVKADDADAYNPSIFAYYEGAVSISGTHTGVGFLELTGY